MRKTKIVAIAILVGLIALFGASAQAAGSLPQATTPASTTTTLPGTTAQPAQLNQEENHEFDGEENNGGETQSATDTDEENNGGETQSAADTDNVQVEE